MRWSTAVILLSATACTSVSPQNVDLSPLSSSDVDVSTGILPAFPDYEVIDSGGDRRDRPRGGAFERVRKTYGADSGERYPWSVDVSVSLFDSPIAAARDLDSLCAAFSRDPLGQLEVRLDERLRYCLSPVVQLRNDPEGGYLPTNTYFSILLVQRGPLVVRLMERRRHSSETAKNPIIVELGERLSKLDER